MTTVATIWLILPLFVGFCLYLMPRVDRFLALGVAAVSSGFGGWLILQQATLNLALLDRFGVSLRLDDQSGFFILTNGLVTAAVILYCWGSDRKAYFYTQLCILHGSLNSVFACDDFMSVYVALECASIAVFLLISYKRSERAVWVALRYLFISNTAMLFYLMGAVLVYQASSSFAFSGLSQAPVDAVVLILIGLLTKGGVFISGLWLPMTHSESEIPVSAMLSGVAIKAGIFPLLRCAELLEGVNVVIRVFAMGTALLGVFFAIFERDIKRVFALSTISQMGFVLAVPAMGGVYALGHGLAKATLFLSSSALPSRRMDELRQKPMGHLVWGVIAIAGLSLAGLPLLVGFGAKSLVLKNVLSWQIVVMNTAAVGTAIVFARILFLPHSSQSEKPLPSGLLPAVSLLILGLVLGGVADLAAYSFGSVAKAIGTIGLGWLIYLFIGRFTLKLPQPVEKLENLIGIMSLVLIGLFSWALV
ncbi:MAG: cation:proton antiporter [Leptolyngbya sp. SIOISBB]|nr:cation:proton antiporter [Leptolyngbya sp. SIOISBB]